MQPDRQDIIRFYGRSDGIRAARVLARTAAAMLTCRSNARLLAVGPCGPLLTGFDPASIERLAIADPFALAPWPDAAGNLLCSANPRHLPFADALFDQAIICHTLEHDARPDRILRELWRVLAPAGEAVLFVANRAGLWTHFEATPFGHGHPYGRNQLQRLIDDALFEVREWRQLLVAPPVRGLRWLDTPLSRLLPRLGGVHAVRIAKVDGAAPTLVGQAQARLRLASQPG